MTTFFCLTGGRVLSPEGTLDTADIAVADGRIVETPAAGAAAIDCRGLHVLPGIVDVHGDAFERELHPRPGVDVAFPIAMGSVDRQVLGNGVTTAFHGLTLSWEPGARSLDAGRRFMASLAALRPCLIADHRVQLRWETFAHDALGDLARWLAETPTPALAFNDHTTSTMTKIEAGNHKKIGQWAERAGMTVDDYVAEAVRVSQRAAEVPARIREVADLAAGAGAVMLAHDEAARAEREAFRGLGVRVSEFPLARDVSEDAVAHGEHVVMGAPNVIRGGSHNGALSAEEAVHDGLCTVLASDYYYPSLFHAAEHLVARGVRPFGDIWNLVSRNPADAMALGDRGRIEPGRRADLLVVDCAGPWRLVHTIVAGRITSFGA